MSCERFRSKINSRVFDIAGVEEQEEWENENVKQDAFQVQMSCEKFRSKNKDRGFDIAGVKNERNGINFYDIIITIIFIIFHTLPLPYSLSLTISQNHICTC